MTPRRTPPSWLTAGFHTSGLSWYLHGEAPDHVLRAYDGGPACWLAQFDDYDRPCSGELEVCHLLARKEIRRTLRHVLVTDLWADGAIHPDDVDDLVELAEWDPRNAAPACEGHHRRFDSHLTPALKVPLEALPFSAVFCFYERGLESEAERKFPGGPGGSMRDLLARIASHYFDSPITTPPVRGRP